MQDLQLTEHATQRLKAALADCYRIEQELGRGGTATVFLAHDLKHDRSVALKVLHPELAAAVGPERFLREIRTTAQLDHPHILPVFDSGQAAGLLWYTMPYVEGESLRQCLRREVQLPIEEAIRITGEVADALECAHQHGVIHRDVKPENILLGAGHARVADFSVARAVQAAGGPALTETGIVVGTPQYMSPEQARGAEHLDGRSDQYSLACVLYEMLVGHPPFEGVDLRAILARHSMEPVPSPRLVRHSIPPSVEDALLRALEKTAADRFPSVRDFARAISAVDSRHAAHQIPPTSLRTWGDSPPKSPPIRMVGLVRSRGLGFWLPTAAFGLLVVLGLSAWRIWLRQNEASSSMAGISPNRIAVMYFSNRGGPDSLGYLADAITEALIHELSGVPTLQVISSGGVSTYKKANLPAHSIARILKVGTLVRGDVAQSGDRLRVSVSLINTGTGTEIGSKTLERPRQEIFALQDDLTEEVAIFLRQRLGQEVELQKSRAQTTSAAAWELLQRAQQEIKGVEPLVRENDTSAAIRQLSRADSLLSQAERLDPKWVRPVTQRGWLAYREARLSSSFSKSYYAERISKGMVHVNRALTLQPNDPDALELRGTLRYLRWLLNLAPDQLEAAQLMIDAERDLRASVAANNTQASAWTTLSHLLLNKGEIGEAKLAALRAYDSDPYFAKADLTVWRLFTSSLDLEDSVEARRWCAEGQRRFPADPRFAECQIWLFALRGEKPDINKAWELLDLYVRLSPPNKRDFLRLRGQMLVAIALARAGLADSARSVAVRSRADATLDPPRELVSYEALVRIILGEKDEAIRLLTIYYATNPQQRPGGSKDESWWYRDLKGDPRYEALMQTLTPAH